MSVGGLNHYFPTKADLLFWPLMPASCEAGAAVLAGRRPQLIEHERLFFGRRCPRIRQYLRVQTAGGSRPRRLS